MTDWRRIFQTALAGVCGALLLVGCSNSGGDDGGSIQTGGDARLNANPTSVQFASISVGETDTRTVELSNEGDAALELSNIQLQEGGEDDKREFTATQWTEEAVIRPEDGPLVLEVAYSPENSISDTAEITLDMNTTDTNIDSTDVAGGGEGNSASVSIPLQPQDLTPQLTAPSRVNFGNAQPESQVSSPFTVQNTGQAPLTINQIQTSGSERFEVKFPNGGDGSGEDDDKDGDGSGDGDPSMDRDPNKETDRAVDEVLPVTIQPSESIDLRGWFEPVDNEPEEATVTLFSNDPEGQKTIKLIGNSKAPCLNLSNEESVKFGVSSIGEVSTRTVTMENCRPQSETQLEISNIELTDDGDGNFSLDESTLPGDLANGDSFALQGGSRANFSINFTPPDEETYTGELLLESNDPAKRSLTIELSGKGTDNQCPEATARVEVKGSGRSKSSLNTLPLETVVLDGSNSQDPDGTVERFEWSIIDRPEDSTARLAPNNTVEKPELFLDLAGTYRVELIVTDDDQVASCGDRALVEITALPEDDISVQLVWDTPRDPDQTDSEGTDLDLHYLNNENATAWNSAPWDCYWNNKSPEKWGSETTSSDDPSLDIDDTDGAGPENVTHDNPKEESYGVGVYYYDDNGFGPSFATVRVFVNGQLAREYENKFLSGTFTFWDVVDIQWPTGNLYTRDEIFTGFPTIN